jgi:hypothetical protein
MGCAGPGSLAGLRWVGPLAAACGRRGRAEGLPANFAGLGCKSATMPAGRERSRAKGTGLGQKKRKRVEGGREPFQLFKTTQTNEFKQRFEFKHSKQCTSMYATVNSYISLIN